MTSCVEPTAFVWPDVPARSRAALVFSVCDSQVRVHASALPPHDSAFAEPECAGTRGLWVAYLARSLESLGFEPGPVSLEACSLEDSGCCLSRRVEQLELTLLHELTRESATNDGPPWIWPAELAALELRSRCRCGDARFLPSIQAPGQEFAWLAAVGDTDFVLMTARFEEGDRDSATVYELSLAELSSPGFSLSSARSASIAATIYEVEVDERGRIILGTGAGEVLVGNVETGFRTLTSLPPGRNARRVRPCRGRCERMELAASSDGYPHEIYVYRDGAWDVLGDASQMHGHCAHPKISGNGISVQELEILWLGPDELIVQPAGNEKLRTITSSTHPHGFWHIVGGDARWVRGPSPETDCLFALAYSETHGVVAGAADGGLHAWDGQTWTRLEFLPRLGLEPPRGDVHVVHAIPGGLLYGGREGRLYYTQDDVLCGELRPSSDHLRDIITLGDTVLVGTEKRDQSAGAQLLRLRILP